MSETLGKDAVDSRSFDMEELKSFRMSDGTIYAVAGHNPKLRLISEVWLGDFRTEQGFRDVVLYMVSLLETGNYDYWFADMRFVANMHAPAEDWVFGEMFPKVLAMGLKRFAIVGPPLSAAGVDVTEAVEYARLSFKKYASDQIRSFADMATAKKWLLTGE